MKRALVMILALFMVAASAFAGGQQEGEEEQGAVEGPVVTTAGPGETYEYLSAYTAESGEVTIAEFREAPSLQEKVRNGELPPLEERLPTDVLVVKPKDQIGRYGGTVVTGATGPTWGGGDDWQIRAQYLLRLLPDMTTIVPNLAKGYEFSDDLATITFFLREGVKWSDGHPFTTEDVLFWYEDVQLNRELNPTNSSTLSPGGEFVRIEIVDDYTFRAHFAVPYPPILNLAAVGMFECYQPKHYLQQFHIKYNPDVEADAKEAGFDTWYEYFQDKAKFSNGQQQEDPALPTLAPWMLTDADATGTKFFGRNPYYWKVDTDGNQLPYLETQIKLITENAEVFGLKAMAGELNAAGQWLSIRDFPVYKEAEVKGGYRAMLFPSSYGSNVRYTLNLEIEDPVKHEVFNDLRFRQALSLAINRDEINDTFFFGRAVPRQATATPETAFYEEWMGEHFAEYDPDRAGELLDEMGMEMGSDGYRTAPDGSPFSFEILVVAGEQRDRVTELVQRYWQAIGVNAIYRLIERSLSVERMQANQADCYVWDQSNSSEFGMQQSITRMSPAGAEGATVLWRTWHNTNGADGVEPPADAKRVYELMDEWQTKLPGTAEYEELGREFLTISVNNLWHIGTVGLSPWPVIIQNNLANTPSEGVWGWEYRRFLPFAGDQWYMTE